MQVDMSLNKETKPNQTIQIYFFISFIQLMKKMIELAHFEVVHLGFLFSSK